MVERSDVLFLLYDRKGVIQRGIGAVGDINDGSFGVMSDRQNIILQSGAGNQRGLFFFADRIDRRPAG